MGRKTRQLQARTVTTVVALGTAAVVAGAVTATAPAAAAAGTASSPPSQDAATSFVVPRPEQVSAQLYWTAERQRRAVQGDVLTRRPAAEPPAPATRSSLAGPANPLAASPPTVTGAAYTEGGQVSRSTGKLFVTHGGVDYACSASIVPSTSRDLAVTAGHCLHGGGASGRFATNVAFAPGSANGSAPYGLWSARKIVTTAGWSARQDFDLDVGFIALNTRNNLHVQQVVGSLGIVFNVPRSNYQWAFGYPALPPYNGSRLSYCAGLPAPDPYGGTALGLRCTMTAGASGGPWTVWMSWYAPGHGFVDSVASYNYQEDPSRIYGPYFGEVVRALYTTSKSM